MTKFNDDNDLGKVIAKKQLFSFGAAPLTSLKEIVFAAGGNKFSSLCGFRFESKAETEYKEFFISFVCKLRSKIYRQATANPSQWFIFKKISGKEMHCLSKDDLRNQYGFDIKKFFDSDYFLQSLVKFKASIDKGLKTYVPEFVKKHGMEKAKDLLTSYDGQNDALIKDAIGRYSNAIKDSLEYIDDTLVNDKFYKLIDYDIAVESEQYDLNAWKSLQKKWEKPRDDGDILEDIDKIIPNLKKVINDNFKGSLKDYLIENAITYVLDDEGNEKLWEDSDTPEKFIQNIIEVIKDGRAEFKESELAEDDIVAEASKWDCEVKKEEQDGEAVWSIYEKTGNNWVATFHDEQAANAFAKEYPKMKETYLKQAREAETKQQMTEGENMKKQINETDGEWSLYAKTLRTYAGYQFYVDVHPNHFYTQKAAEMWKKTFEDAIFDALEYWYGQTIARDELYVCRASDIHNDRIVSFDAAEHDPKYKDAWKAYQEELKKNEHNAADGIGNDKGQKAYNDLMRREKNTIDRIREIDHPNESEKELDDKIEEALKEIYK